MRTSVISIQNTATLICFLQIVSYILTITTGLVPIIAVTYLYLVVNMGLFCLIYYKGINARWLINVLFFLTLFILFTSLSSDEYPLKFELLLVGLNSLLIGILYKGNLAYKLTYYTNILVNLLVFYVALKSGFHPNFGGTILLQGSRNIVNAYLIMGIVYYLFFCFTNREKVNILLVLLFTVNCILLQGRSGVALSILILLYSLYTNASKVRTVIITLLSTLSFSYILNFIITSTKFSQGTDTGRSHIFKEYFTDIGFKEIIFGRSINECCSIIVSYDFNPHNSFIRGHMLHGLIHTVLFIYIFITVLRTRSLNLIFLITVLYVRHSFDWVGLFRSFDAVIFSIFVYSYYINHTKRSQTKYYSIQQTT